MIEQRDFKLGDKVLIDKALPAVTVTGFRRFSGREAYRLKCPSSGDIPEWISAYRLSSAELAEPKFAGGDVEDAVFEDDAWQPLDSATDALPWIGSQVDIRDEGGRLHTGKLLMIQVEETTTTLILSGEVSVRISDGLCIRDSRPFQDITTHEQAIALIGKLCELEHVSTGSLWLAHVDSVVVYGSCFELHADPALVTASSEYGPIRARVIGE